MRLTRNRLASLRMASGYPTAEEGARALGCSRDHLTNVERGRSNPSETLAQKMADLYGVDLLVIRYHSNKAQRDLAQRKLDSLKEAEVKP